MNETLRTIKSRRSVRRYQDKPVHDALINEVLEAGLHAPSAMNQQTWDFTVLRSRERIAALNENSRRVLIEKNWGENAPSDIFFGAPVVIIISLEKDSLIPMADCSAAIQNMLLAAESLGLGTCWIGSAIPYFESGDHAGAYGIPATHKPYFAVTLGYPDGTAPKMPPRRSGTVRYLD